MYVNDKLLAGNDETLLDSVQASIGSRFKATVLGDTSWILGIRVCQDIPAGLIFIDQSQYIKSILACYGMADCTPVSTPLSAKANFDPTSPKEHSTVSSYPYLEVIRSLMYAVLGTHPDICSAVRALAPIAAMFGHDHIEGLKHIMRYLASCPSHGIMYTVGEGELVGYTDADWAKIVPTADQSQGTPSFTLGVLSLGCPSSSPLSRPPPLMLSILLPRRLQRS